MDATDYRLLVLAAVEAGASDPESGEGERAAQALVDVTEMAAASGVDLTTLREVQRVVAGGTAILRPCLQRALARLDARGTSRLATGARRVGIVFDENEWVSFAECVRRRKGERRSRVPQPIFEWLLASGPTTSSVAFMRSLGLAATERHDPALFDAVCHAAFRPESTLDLAQTDLLTLLCAAARVAGRTTTADAIASRLNRTELAKAIPEVDLLRAIVLAGNTGSSKAFRQLWLTWRKQAKSGAPWPGSFGGLWRAAASTNDPKCMTLLHRVGLDTSGLSAEEWLKVLKTRTSRPDLLLNVIRTIRFRASWVLKVLPEHDLLELIESAGRPSYAAPLALLVEGLGKRVQSNTVLRALIRSAGRAQAASVLDTLWCEASALSREQFASQFLRAAGEARSSGLLGEVWSACVSHANVPIRPRVVAAAAIAAASSSDRDFGLELADRIRRGAARVSEFIVPDVADAAAALKLPELLAAALIACPPPRAHTLGSAEGRRFCGLLQAAWSLEQPSLLRQTLDFISLAHDPLAGHRYCSAGVESILWWIAAEAPDRATAKLIEDRVAGLELNLDRVLPLSSRAGVPPAVGRLAEAGRSLSWWLIAAWYLRPNDWAARLNRASSELAALGESDLIDTLQGMLSHSHSPHFRSLNLLARRAFDDNFGHLAGANDEALLSFARGGYIDALRAFYDRVIPALALEPATFRSSSRLPQALEALLGAVVATAKRAARQEVAGEWRKEQDEFWVAVSPEAAAAAKNAASGELSAFLARFVIEVAGAIREPALEQLRSAAHSGVKNRFAIASRQAMARPGEGAPGADVLVEVRTAVHHLLASGRTLAGRGFALRHPIDLVEVTRRQLDLGIPCVEMELPDAPGGLQAVGWGPGAQDLLGRALTEVAANARKALEEMEEHERRYHVKLDTYKGDSGRFSRLSVSNSFRPKARGSRVGHGLDDVSAIIRLFSPSKSEYAQEHRDGIWIWNWTFQLPLACDQRRPGEPDE
jgi:hypothetical protein